MRDIWPDFVIMPAMAEAIDPNNPVIRLCMEGTQAEFDGRLDDARSLYRQAWETAQDDYEACVAAHYVARFQEEPEEILHWNQVALDRANAVLGDRVQSFYPSLYLNMGSSYEKLGRMDEAQHYYDMAAALGAQHRV
jgi:tetratricopeptide (TPR) repeat protein